MARMGHDSERAALIYQHESLGADRAITEAIDRRPGLSTATTRTAEGSSGALAPVS